MDYKDHKSFLYFRHWGHPILQTNACFHRGCIFNPQTRGLTLDPIIILQILVYRNSDS